VQYLKVEFDVKYGENIIAIPLGNGTYKFKVKYGTNVLVLPEIVKKHDNGMTDLWSAKVTIYNDVEETAVEGRRFERFVIPNCNVQGGFVTKADGTVENIVNAKTIITKAVEYYKSPREYKLIPKDQRSNFFTVNANDFVVLGEVDDVVTTPLEFQQLQKKYKDYGVSVTAVNEYLYGTTVDNVQIIHA
jgi:hypothetical protein